MNKNKLKELYKHFLFLYYITTNNTFYYLSLKPYEL